MKTKEERKEEAWVEYLKIVEPAMRQYWEKVKEIDEGE